MASADRHGNRRSWWRLSRVDPEDRVDARDLRRCLARLRAPVHIGERLLRDYTIPVAVMLSLALVFRAVVDMGNTLRRAREIQATAQRACGMLAAEEAACAAVRDDRAAMVLATSWGIAARIERAAGPLPGFSIRVETGPERAHYWCEHLRGAAPAAFARALTLGNPWPEVPAWLSARGAPHIGDLPSLQLPAPAATASKLPGLRCDTEVAFLHLAGGTDRADFSLAAGVRQLAVPVDTQLVVLDGNLWLPPADEPLAVHLRAPLTIVVFGNVYLGRSVTVVGSHPCTVVAHRTSATFQDLDGDGGRSAGEPTIGAGACRQEGDGSLYLGLPTRRRLPLTVDAHLVAEGEVHLLTRVEAHGALIGAAGITRCSDSAELTLTGRGLLDVERERVPGFATIGAPRPGWLRRVGRD